MRFAAAARRGMKSFGLKAGLSSSFVGGGGGEDGGDGLLSAASVALLALAAGLPRFRLLGVAGAAFAGALVEGFVGVAFAGFVAFLAVEVPGAGLGEGETRRFLLRADVRFGTDRGVGLELFGPSVPSVLEVRRSCSSLKKNPYLTIHFKKISKITLIS